MSIGILKLVSDYGENYCGDNVCEIVRNLDPNHVKFDIPSGWVQTAISKKKIFVVRDNIRHFAAEIKTLEKEKTTILYGSFLDQLNGEKHTPMLKVVPIVG